MTGEDVVLFLLVVIPEKLVGAVGTRMNVTLIDVFQVHLDLDNNGDGTIDFEATTTWVGSDDPVFAAP
jgi:hypothetical protein